jgi:hypothetical protein
MTAEPTPHLRVVEDPEIEHLRHELMDERIRRHDLEKDIASKRRRIGWLERQMRDQRKADPLYETAFQLWEFWRDKLHPGAYVFSEDAEKVVLARLREKKTGTDEPAWPPRYIAEAIMGAVVDAYVDPKGKRHDSLELICRNAGKLYDFHGRWERYKAKQA